MDKKTTTIIAGVTGVVVVGAAAFLLLRPKGEEPTDTPPPVTKKANAGDGASGTKTASGQTPASGGQAAPGTGTSGAGTGASGARKDPFDAKAAGGMKVAGAPGASPGLTGLGRVRKDPFYVEWRVLPPPPNVFEEVQPVRIASTGVVAPPPAPVTVAEVPDRRVSGIMSGDGVFAVLEGVGEPEIVKPGGKTRDGFSVVSINDDSVKLQKREGNIIRTQLVMLSDTPVGSVAPTGGGGRFGNPQGGMGSGPAGFPGNFGGGRGGKRGDGGGLD